MHHRSCHTYRPFCSPPTTTHQKAPNLLLYFVACIQTPPFTQPHFLAFCPIIRIHVNALYILTHARRFLPTSASSPFATPFLYSLPFWRRLVSDDTNHQNQIASFSSPIDVHIIHYPFIYLPRLPSSSIITLLTSLLPKSTHCPHPTRTRTRTDRTPPLLYFMFDILRP